jgi:hypothetical protein
MRRGRSSSRNRPRSRGRRAATCIRDGAEIKIVYTGKQTTKAGREFKPFEVFVASADDLLDEPSEVPFWWAPLSRCGRARRGSGTASKFYQIAGQAYPSVTTVLSVLNKPALGPWFAKEERRHFETALLEVATRF